ncbi:ABC transporter ATP-binding protein [Agromyces bauzanensis]
MDAIEVQGLTKTYGGVAVVDGISMNIGEGEVFSLLGPNGAGKTTTVEMLEGHRQPDGGTISVLGFDPQRRERAFRERIGVVLQEAGFDDEFTVRELVRYFHAFYAHPLGVDDVIELVGLEHKGSAKVKTLSGGQRRRLDLALGLIGDPDVLFLDEPTVGFDPAARRQAWSVIEQLKTRGTTILLTTHYLDEAEHLADRVAVMVAGRLVAVGPPAELAAGRAGATVSFRLPPGTTVDELPELGARPVEDGAGWRLSTEHPSAVVHALTGWAIDRGSELPALEVRRPSLEDAYLDLVGEAGVTAGDADPGDTDPDDADPDDAAEAGGSARPASGTSR